MRRSSVITTIVFGAAVAAGDAEARLDLYVDKAAQQIQVIRNGTLLYVWPVSTGRDRFSTPSGVYRPERLERSWFSTAYYNAPMPHAIFFHNGYAIHGSYEITRLGGPASHGCVRLHPQSAALLFALVQQEGPSNTTIFVGGNSNRPRYRDYDEPVRPLYRRDNAIARSAYPPDPRIDPRMPPGESPDQYVDGGGAWPPPRQEMAPYYNDRYANPGAYPRNPDLAPYYEADPYADWRRAPHDPRATPDYSADPYIDRRGAPNRPGVAPYSPYYPDRRSDGRDASPHGPKMPPYDADRYADGQGRRRGDVNPMAMRGADPANRLPAPRLDGGALPARGGLRPATTGAKSRLPPLAEEPPHLTMGEAAKARPPVLPPAPTPSASFPTAPPPPAPSPAPVAQQDPAPEQQPSNTGFGYKVLPKSYWAGASWRWRIKRDDGSAPPATSP